MRFASYAATVASLCILAKADDVEAQQAAGLNAAITSRGKSYVGTALTWRRDDDAERRIITPYTEFGSITVENALKWNSVEPNRGRFNWTESDRVVDYAVQNNKYLRCHALIMEDQLPDWVTDQNWNNASLLSAMETHIREVVGRYRGRCNSWDVVNNALNEDGSLKNNLFYRTIGENYIPLSFWAVSQVDPNVKLYYNDFNMEFNNAKTAGAVRLVRAIQQAGIKIDGVGLQGHFVAERTNTQSAPVPSVDTLMTSLRAFTDLGVDVAYSEVDVRTNTPMNNQRSQAQADGYTRVVQSCMRVQRCVGMTFWGISDKYSWFTDNDRFQGEGEALLWDKDFNKKVAYRAVLNAIVSG